MDAARAEAIINEVKSRGLLERDMPEQDEEKVALARQIVDNARTAHDAEGQHGEAVMAVLGLADSNGGPAVSAADGDAAADVPVESPPQEPPVAENVTLPSATQGAPLHMHEREGLPVPPDIEGDAVEFPRDLSSLSDRELRRVHAVYTAYLVRTIWLVGLAKADTASAKHMAEWKYQQAYKKVNQKNDDGTKRLADDIVADAELDPEVVEWRAKHAQHEGDLTRLYALRDIYKEACDRLSRDWTMRSDEHMRSGGGQR